MEDKVEREMSVERIQEGIKSYELLRRAYNAAEFLSANMVAEVGCFTKHCCR